MPEDELTTESTVYVCYLASTAQRVWEALTLSDLTQQYFFGCSVVSDWCSGSTWTLQKPDGAVDVTGIVQESRPPHRLILSWRVEGIESLKNVPEAIVSYDIEPLGENVVRLTMTEAHPSPIPAHLLQGGRRGWPMILSGLKTLLETGKPLDLPTPQPPKRG